MDGTHHPYFAGRRSHGVDDEMIRIQLWTGAEEVDEDRALVVPADPPDYEDLGPECREVRADIGRPAQDGPFRFAEQHRHRRLGDNRSTEPDRYLSSIKSPTTMMRQPVKLKWFMDLSKTGVFTL